MANQKISAMSPASTPLTGTETVAGVQSAANVKIKTSDIAALAPAPTGANPTATASDTAVNGVAATFMRSDGAPAVQKGSSSQFGIVKNDGTTLTDNGAGVLSVPQGSASVQGGVKVDNTSITAAAGVISAVAANAGGTVAGVVKIDNKSIHINGSNKIATGIMHPGFASGRYYTTFSMTPSNSFASYGANVIRAVPFYVPFPVTFTRTAMKTNTSGQHIEWGIWTTNNGVPDQLLYDFGSQATVLNAVIELTGLTIALDAGTYALGSVVDGSVSITPFGNLSVNEWALGMNDPAAAGVAGGWTGSFTYNANNLPTTFPSPAFADSQTIPLPTLRL